MRAAVANGKLYPDLASGPDGPSRWDITKSYVPVTALIVICAALIAGAFRAGAEVQSYQTQRSQVELRLAAIEKKLDKLVLSSSVKARVRR